MNETSHVNLNDLRAEVSKPRTARSSAKILTALNLCGSAQDVEPRSFALKQQHLTLILNC
jgi:hypothetical protein